MSYGVTFDDFEYEGELELRELKPFWMVKDKDEKEILEWLNNDFDLKKRISEPRVRTYREMLALYKGIHYRSQETRSQDFRRDASERSIRNPKVVVNHVYDMVETKTAKMSRFRPAIAVMPANNEYHDKNNAKTAKVLVDSHWSKIDIDEIFRQCQRMSYVFGEGFIKTFWDKDAGDIHPLYEELKGDIPAMDAKGEIIHDEDGKPVKIKKVIKQGDVCYKVVAPEFIFPEPYKQQWCDVDNLTELEYKHIDELKHEFPDKENKIKEHKGTRFDPQTMEQKKVHNETEVKHFWHKPTKYFPEGVHIVYTEHCILKVESFPYNHKSLPFLRLTDIDVPTELHARSFIINIRQLQRHFNNLASGIARNHGLASAPKWVMPKGACKISALGNDLTVVEYNGQVPPRLEQLSPTSPEIFGYMDKLETYIQKLSAVHGISRGAPPPGIRAGVALQFLDEQEAERENNGVAKRNSLIKEVAKQTIALMGQFYKPHDGRLIKILGKDNSQLVKSFQLSDFSTNYDVRIQNSSSLPDSKAAKIQSIIDLSQSFPTLFTQEQVVDMLDLASSESFKDHSTVAVKAAESENESMMMGEPVEEPKEWEDLIIHYKIHLRELQARQFKEEMPSEFRAALIDHLEVTEMLMWKKANENALFRQMVMSQFPQFPVFFKMDEVSEQVLATGGLPQPGMVPGAAQGGEGEAVQVGPEMPMPEPIPEGEKS